MIEDGALEHVTAIFGLHLASDHPIGSVASKPGPRMAASGFFEALISGKGGRAAIPQHTIDPILAASNVIVSLQHLVSREADPLDSQVCSLSLYSHNKVIVKSMFPSYCSLIIQIHVSVSSHVLALVYNIFHSAHSM